MSSCMVSLPLSSVKMVTTGSFSYAFAVRSVNDAGGAFAGKGAASGTVTATPDAVPAVPPTYPPRITGSAWMNLTVGYAATSTNAFTITGTTPVTVTKLSGNDLITWNNTDKTLDIAEGLPVGVYEVRLRASNSVSTFTFTFTLTVEKPVYYLDIPRNVEGGTVEALTKVPYLAEEGETVTLIITPHEGYELVSLSVISRDGARPVSTICTGNTCTFTMPAHHITIVAVYRDLRTVSNEQWTIDNGQLKAYAQNGVLYVSGLQAGDRWSVYNIFGALVYQGVALSDKAEVPLPGKGIYIIMNGKESLKAVIP